MHMGDREARPSSFSEASATVNRQQGVMQNFRSLFAPYSASASSSLRPRGGGYSLIWPIRGCTAGQGVVYGLSVLNRVCDFVRVCPKQGV